MSEIRRRAMEIIDNATGTSKTGYHVTATGHAYVPLASILG